MQRAREGFIAGDVYAMRRRTTLWVSPTEEATDNTGFAFPHIFFYASLLVFFYLFSFYSGVWGRVRRAIAADAAVVSNSGRSSHFALVLCGDFFSFFFLLYLAVYIPLSLRESLLSRFRPLFLRHHLFLSSSFFFLLRISRLFSKNLLLLLLGCWKGIDFRFWYSFGSFTALVFLPRVPLR